MKNGQRILISQQQEFDAMKMGENNESNHNEFECLMSIDIIY